MLKARLDKVKLTAKQISLILMDTLLAMGRTISMALPTEQSEVRKTRSFIEDEPDEEDDFLKIREEKDKQIEMIVRVREFSKAEKGEPRRREAAVKTKNNVLAILDNKFGDQNFLFDKVFGERAKTEQVFQKAKESVCQALEGKNITIFAYGQTGSGKTYTLLGDDDIPGIAQLSFEFLYKLISEQENSFYFDVKATMVQIYNATLEDLLNAQDPRPINI